MRFLSVNYFTSFQCAKNGALTIHSQFHHHVMGMPIQAIQRCFNADISATYAAV